MRVYYFTQILHTFLHVGLRTAPQGEQLCFGMRENGTWAKSKEGICQCKESLGTVTNATEVVVRLYLLDDDVLFCSIYI